MAIEDLFSLLSVPPQGVPDNVAVGGANNIAHFKRSRRNGELVFEMRLPVDAVASRGGAKSRAVTMEDVAGALGMGRLDKLAYTYARAFYLEESSAVAELPVLLAGLLRRRFPKWRNFGPRNASVVASVAVVNLFTPSNAISPGAVAKLLGVDRANYSRVWRERVEIAESKIIDVECVAMYHLRDKLS